MRFDLKTRSSSIVVLTLVLGCNAELGGGVGSEINGVRSPGFAGNGDAQGGIVEELPEGLDEVHLLPARIRRLTNAEYDASVRALLNTEQAFGETFPPDTRQHGYTVNEAQRIDPVLARALATAAVALAEEAVGAIDTLAPCGDAATSGRVCAEEFVDRFASQAYRRPLADEEREGLLSLYDAATTGAGLDLQASPEQVYADGIELIIQGALQAPGFLYVTETGGVEPVGTVQLTGHEIASALSYLVTGEPPDQELLTLVESGALTDSETRAAQVRRLAVTPAGRQRSIAIVEEWLGLDQIEQVDKDTVVFPNFGALREEMAAETRSFVREALEGDGATVASLLGGESDVAEPALGALYAASGPSRNGLLNRGAFLSVNAHAQETAPIWRGTAVMRRVACIDIELPTSLDVEIIPPAPDPSLTTRERFVVHTQDAACASCHSFIDPIGFAFEQFDGMGAHQATDNGKPVDSAGTVAVGKDFDGSYQSSTDLAAALAESTDVASCFTRQIFRAAAAEGAGIEEPEDGFVTRSFDPEVATSLVETLVAYAADDTFILRSNL